MMWQGTGPWLGFLGFNMGLEGEWLLGYFVPFIFLYFFLTQRKDIDSIFSQAVL